MADLPRGRLGAVLDLGEQFRLDPDALVRDPSCVGLGFFGSRASGACAVRRMTSYRCRSQREVLQDG